MANKLLGAAHNYAEDGFSIIPIREGDKKPLESWQQFQNEHPDESQLEQWFLNYPNRNLAIVTGKISGVFVVDVDDEEAWKNFSEDKALPPRPTVSTPGGIHHYFELPNIEIKNSVRDLPGADIRAEGGYVVAPPSSRPEGEYGWAPHLSLEDLSPPPAPDWLLKELEKTTSEDSTDGTTDSFENPLEGVSKGQRNNEATKRIGRWFGKGLDPEEIWELAKSWNQKNSPPLPEDELRSVFESIKERDEEGTLESFQAAEKFLSDFSEVKKIRKEPGEISSIRFRYKGQHVEMTPKQMAKKYSFVREINAQTGDWVGGIDGLEKKMFKLINQNLHKQAEVIDLSDRGKTQYVADRIVSLLEDRETATFEGLKEEYEGASYFDVDQLLQEYLLEDDARYYVSRGSFLGSKTRTFWGVRVDEKHISEGLKHLGFGEPVEEGNSVQKRVIGKRRRLWPIQKDQFPL